MNPPAAAVIPTSAWPTANDLMATLQANGYSPKIMVYDNSRILIHVQDRSLLCTPCKITYKGSDYVASTHDYIKALVVHHFPSVLDRSLEELGL